ncbi:MAG: hypothetical protein ACRYFR_12415 [Janthinobacterium lividum]
MLYYYPIAWQIVPRRSYKTFSALNDHKRHTQDRGPECAALAQAPTNDVGSGDPQLLAASMPLRRRGAGAPGTGRRRLRGHGHRLALGKPAAPFLAGLVKRWLVTCCLLLATTWAAGAQSYTYTVGEGQLRPTQDVTLRADESLYIPPNTVYTGQVTFEGTGQLVVNDWVWIAATVALPAQATLTNHYMLSLEQLTLAAGATMHNAHQCATTALELADGATLQNDADAWMQVYSEAFTNAGLIRNCGTFLAQSWAAGGRVVDCTPLPVQLVCFTAEPAAGAVALRWRTAQEVNAARYEVERSADGQLFSLLSQQAAKGAGAYAASDKARPGPQYYRLRLVDADASFSYSPVAVVNGAALVNRAWYNEVGQRLGAPQPGFLLEVSTYTNGAVESRKYLQE